jgi:hypothetical protein
MTEPVSPSIQPRSSLARFFRWLFSWRGARRLLIVTAWAATIIALLYGIENWRGRRAWKKHEQQLLARGEQLDFNAFLLKPIPDAQNFAATPFVASWSIKHNDETNIWQDSYWRVANHVAGRKDQPRRSLMDLVAWQSAFEALRSGQLPATSKFQSDKRDPESRRAAALAVLESTKDIEPKIAEMRAASARPYARYPIEFKDDPWSMAFPHLAKLKGACLRIRLRASAELAAGQSAAAFDDVKLLLYVADSVKDEPFVISYLVRIACRDMAIYTIWEGLAQRVWTEMQLQELQARLDERDFLQDLKRNLSAEHAAGILTPDLLRKFGINYLFALGDTLDSSHWLEGPLVMVFGNLAPSGWLYQEKFNYSRLFHMQQQPLFDEAGAVKPRISPAEVKAAASKMDHELAYKFRFAGSALNHTMFASLLLPALGNIAMKAVSGQTSTDHAALACALERYRLANGIFPEKLDALVPQFIAQLPNDLITGEPYKYRRADNGQFILYSVGWNEKDDSGTPGERLYDSRDGDWIWDYSSAAGPQLPPPGKPSVAPSKRGAPGQTILQRAVEGDVNVFKLSPEQVQAFLMKNTTNAESLLAAFNVSGDKEFLREAVRRSPDSPFVLAAALTHDALPDQRRELVDRFKQLAPDNPLADYLSARDHLKNQQPDVALKELVEASSKNGFHDFTIERIQGLEDIYLDAGYTAADAKALAMAGVQLKSIVQLRQLGDNIAALQQQYAAGGDTASAEVLARMGLTLAADIAQGTGNTFIGQMSGSRVERELLRALDPNATYDFVTQPINDRLAHLDAQDKSIREACQFFDQWMRTASEGQLISFFDRLKLYGEPAAITWARTQLPNRAP